MEGLNLILVGSNASTLQGGGQKETSTCPFLILFTKVEVSWLKVGGCKDFKALWILKANFTMEM